MWVWRAVRGGGGEGRCIERAGAVMLPGGGGGGGGGAGGGGRRLLVATVATGPKARGDMEGWLVG